jgi:GH15 family glucan-1,4-alpha-glucosidase
MGERYREISDYGAIGNLRTVALVGRDGSIDWCCFPNLDDASVFAALLDAGRGGRYRVRGAGSGAGEQRYVEGTNVLETVFDAGGGRLRVTDFLPLTGDIHGRGGSSAEPAIHRLLSAEEGPQEVEVDWSPRFDYARGETRIERTQHGWLAHGSGCRLLLAGLSAAEGELRDGSDGPVLHARLRLAEGERRALVCCWERDRTAGGTDPTLRMLEETIATWRGWMDRSTADIERWAGEWAPLVLRSALALKLLTHADTGGIAAAATASLPEWIGGPRNWDYRYTWLRDASLTAQAFLALGHEREATEFLLWLERAAESHQDELQLQIMYGLHGEAELDETELEHLEGYRGSRPVRIGNEAAEQRQLDIYGELLDSAYELARRGVELSDDVRTFLRRVADRATEEWKKPDWSIWEMRKPPQHFVYSKLMVWVALDRAVHLARMGVLEGDVERWEEVRGRVRAEILDRGYDEELRSFVLHYGSDELDAANLLLPMHELLPFDDPRVQGTIDRTLERLTENGLVYRYRADDGIEGPEGAFGLCTFWMVDVLALSGRLDEAWEIFRGIASRANHVGLFSEQIDPASGRFLGNFPQAFTHIGLINSAIYLAYAEGKALPDPAPIGTPDHRKEIGHRASGEGGPADTGEGD